MLLYYFVDKDDLVGATLERVAARLTRMLDAAIPPDTRLSFPVLLVAVWEAISSPELPPYMRLWLELAAASAWGQEPHRAVTSAIMDGFVRWTEDHLATDPELGGERLSALLLTIVEGAMLLGAIGRRDMADTAVANAVKAFEGQRFG